MNASAQTFNAFEETFREEGADFFQKHLKNFWWFEKKRYLSMAEDNVFLYVSMVRGVNS